MTGYEIVINSLGLVTKTTDAFEGQVSYGKVTVKNEVLDIAAISIAGGTTYVVRAYCGDEIGWVHSLYNFISRIPVNSII